MKNGGAPCTPPSPRAAADTRAVDLLRPVRLGCTTYTAREVARDLRDHRAAPGSLSLQTETPELAPHRAQTASDVTIGVGQPEHANKTTPQWQFLYCQTMPCPAMVDATETLRREKG